MARTTTLNQFNKKRTVSVLKFGMKKQQDRPETRANDATAAQMADAPMKSEGNTPDADASEVAGECMSASQDCEEAA